MKFNMSNAFKILILSIYMPCGNQSVTHTDEEYESVINCIETLLENTDCNGVVLCGDWNTAFARDNAQSKCLVDFITRCNLKVAWDHVKLTNGDTYVNRALGHRSCIDHFITSENVYREIVFNSVFDEADNTSTHLPVESCFRTSEFQRIKIEVEQSNSNDQLQWHKAGVNDIINYRRVMDDALSNITIPDGLYCRAVNCKYSVHHSAIEQTCNDVISSRIHAGQTCVPSVKVNGRKRRKCIPG